MTARRCATGHDTRSPPDKEAIHQYIMSTRPSHPENTRRCQSVPGPIQCNRQIDPKIQLSAHQNVPTKRSLRTAHTCRKSKSFWFSRVGGVAKVDLRFQSHASLDANGKALLGRLPCDQSHLDQQQGAACQQHGCHC